MRFIDSWLTTEQLCLCHQWHNILINRQNLCLPKAIRFKPRKTVCSLMALDAKPLMALKNLIRKPRWLSYCVLEKTLGHFKG